MNCLAKIVLAVVLGVLVGGTARAGISYQFADTSGTALSSIDVGPGQTSFDVRVYLVEDGLGPTPTPITSGNGLDRFGIQVRGVDTGDGFLYLVDSSSDIVSNEAQFTGFTSAAINGTPTGQRGLLSDRTPGGFNNGNGVAVDGTGRILLGTFTYTINGSTTIGDSFELEVLDRTAGTDFFTDDGTALDALLGSTSITVNVVPEPGSMVLCGLAAAGIAGGYLRRRFRTVKAI